MNTASIDFADLGTSVLVLALGTMVCLFGFRLIKVVLGLVGFVAGALAAGGLSMLVTSGAPVVLWASAIIGGIIGAFILIWAFKVGVFMVGAVGGFIIGGVVGTSFSGWIQLIIIIVLAVACGFMALRLQRIVIGLSTAVIGAAAIVGAGLTILIGSEPTKELVERVAGGGALEHVGWIAIGSWLLLSIVGAGAQLGRKKKKE